MLAEMLVHFSALAEDLNTDLDQLPRDLELRLRDSLGPATAAIGEETGRLQHAVAQVAARMEAISRETMRQRADVLAGFTAETRKLLTDTVIRQTGVRIWRDRVIVAGIVTALVAGAWGWGRSQGREEMTASIAATQSRLPTAIPRDGTRVAAHWLDLMEWNHPGTAERTCVTQASGPGCRLVCAYTFWDGPPLDDPTPPKR